MKTVKIIIIVLVSVIVSSCGRKSFQETTDTVKHFFVSTTYEGIYDESITYIEDVIVYPNGKLVRVHYMKGVSDKYDYFYVDSESNNVRVDKNSWTMDNGYPIPKGHVYTINDNGMVVVNWFGYGIFMSLVILSIFCLFLKIREK